MGRLSVVRSLFMILMVLLFAATEEHDLRSLGLLFCGAAPLGSTLVNGVRKRLENVGADVCVTQGASIPVPLHTTSANADVQDMA